MTFIAALRHDRVEAPWLIEGPINGETFRLYVDKVLVPTMRPGDIVIMDNLGSHKGKAVRKAIRAVGARLLFLPKYSPDLNPIEQLFSKLKHWLRREGERILFNRNLIGTLRQRELDALGDRLAAETGTPFQKSADGEFVAGTYSRRFALASGRFAMIDDGLGFKLVPWIPSIEKHIGQHISGVARADGGVDWSFGRKRGLGL